MNETLYQKRTRHAWEIISKQSSPMHKLGPHIKNLPIALRVQGLTITLATLNKGDTAELVRVLVNWLSKDWDAGAFLGLQEEKGNVSPDKFINACVDRGRAHWAAVQQEAIAFAQQLKVLSAFIDSGQSYE